jgi:hypothetical protein
MKLSVLFVDYRLLLPPDLEVGAAAAIHPNSISVASPGAPKNAGRAAALANQANFSARSFSAIMASPVAGLAIEGLNETVTVAATTVTAAAIILAGHKFGATAAIHPDATSVIAPCPPRDARRIAALAYQADASSSISGAIIKSPIVRSAIYLILGSRVGNATTNENKRQQCCKYTRPIAGKRSKLNLIQGHKSPFTVRVRITWGVLCEEYA